MTDTNQTPALGRQVGGEHYKGFAIQPVEFAMANGLNACQSSITKYLLRDKDSIRQDLEKSIHYAELWGELVKKYRLPMWGSAIQARHDLSLPHIKVDAFVQANNLPEPVAEILHLFIDAPNERRVAVGVDLIRGML